MISLNHICYGILTLKVIRGHRMSLYVNKVKVEKYALKPYFWHEYSYDIFDQHKLWHFDHKAGIHINIFNLPSFMWGPMIFKRVKQNNKKITLSVNIFCPKLIRWSMYIYIYIHIYVCVYVCVCMHMPVWKLSCLYVYICLWSKCMCMNLYVHDFVCG